ncbi:MAG: signal peptidase I [Clostridiales bacterium]|nr:signal peptidase I [Clostridiales bacterium]
MKKHLSFIFRIILIIIISVTFGLGIYNWNASTLSGNKLPMPLGFGLAVVVSGSMEPELSVNDLIFVVQTGDYGVRDIVVFQDGSSLVVHRIIRTEGEGEDLKFITQGDANNAEDPAISLNEIKGEVIFALPFVGVIVQFLKSFVGTLLVIALAGFLYFKSFKKEREKDDAETDAIIDEIKRLKNEIYDSSAPNGTEIGKESSPPKNDINKDKQ